MLPSPQFKKKKSSLKSAFFLRSKHSFLLSFNPTAQPYSSNFVQGNFFLFRSLNSTSNNWNTFFCNKSEHSIMFLGYYSQFPYCAQRCSVFNSLFIFRLLSEHFHTCVPMGNILFSVHLFLQHKLYIYIYTSFFTQLHALEFFPCPYQHHL